MVVVVGLGIRWLDGLLATALSGQLDSRRALMRVAFAVTAAAGMGDLVWGGSFTYAERTVFRIGVLALLWLLFAWRVPKPEATRPPRSSTVVSRR